MTDSVTRRGALGLGLTAVGFAATSCAARAAAQPPERAPSQSGQRELANAPAQHDVVPLPFDAAKLAGLSMKLLTLHHDKNYGGAVKKLNLIRSKLPTADASQSGSYWSEFGTLKAGEAAARNSALLHELYFANLVGPGQRPPPGIGQALAQRFGSVDSAIDRINACGKATGGWVILALDRSSRTIEIVPTDGHRGGAWHAEALIVLDVFEHSYALDYGPDKGSYLAAFFNNLNWVEVGKRFDAASQRG
jgi:Fe-Mn family superoxide dismutase